MLLPTVYARSLLALAILVCALALHAPQAYGQTEGILIVKTKPVDAQVRLLYVKPKFEQGIKLTPGNYMIDVKADGYETVFRELTIKAGATTTVEVTLKPLPGTTPKPDETPKEAPAKDDAKPVAPEAPDDAKGKPDENTDAAKPAGQLFVETQPEGATIRILSIKPKFKQGIELAPGTYRISISKDGYLDAEAPAEIKPGEKTTLKVQLERDKPGQEELPLNRKGFGRLYVDAEPADATIRVLRIKPVFEQGIELKADKYTVDVQKDGFEKQVLRVEIKDREATHLSVALTPEGTQAAPSEPAQPSSNASANTTTANATSATPETKPEAEEPREAPPAEAKVVSSTNQTGARDAIAAGHGKLLLNMTPPDAEASIMELETRYQHGMALPVGNYTISFIKDGYEDHSVRAIIEDGKALTLDVTLKPESAPVASSFAKIKEADAADLKSSIGKLFLEVSPADATVMVLNIKPKFEQGMELKAGSYRLEIRRDGYTPMRVVVSISPRKAVTYRVVLQPAVEEPGTEAQGKPGAETPPPPPVPSVNADQARAFLEQGRSLLKEGREDKALELLSQAIEQDPSLTEALQLRAALFSRQKKNEQALEDYSRAIKLSNKTPQLYVERAQLNERMGLPAAACYDYWMACSLDACDGIREAQKRGLCQ